MQTVLNVQCTGFKFFKKLVPTSLVKKLGLLVDFLLFNKYIFIIIFHGTPIFYEYTYLLCVRWETGWNKIPATHFRYFSGEKFTTPWSHFRSEVQNYRWMKNSSPLVEDKGAVVLNKIVLTPPLCGLLFITSILISIPLSFTRVFQSIWTFHDATFYCCEQKRVFINGRFQCSKIGPLVSN